VGVNKTSVKECKSDFSQNYEMNWAVKQFFTVSTKYIRTNLN